MYIMKEYFNKYFIYLFLILFLIYTIWKFNNALLIGYTVSAPQGDGLGTIAWMSELVENLHERGISYLFSDLTILDKAGLGIHGPVPINIVQKLIIAFLSLFTSLDNIYDYYAMIGFYLMGIFTYLLLREFKISILFSLLGVLLMVNADNTYSRMTAHLTLSIPFASILLIYLTVKASKNPTLFRLILVAFAIGFNFSMNEYYGYFGVFFVLFLFFGLLLFYKDENTISNMQLLKNIILGSGVLFIIMSILYPNLIFYKILSLFLDMDMSSSVAGVKRTYADFILYSVKNPWYLFYPKLDFAQEFLNLKFFTNNTFGEQSFRIGILVPIIIAIILYTLTIVSVLQKRIHKELKLFIYVFPSIIIIYLLSNDPHYGYSLVNFTYALTDIFRVSSRAYLYIFIILLCLYVYYLNYSFWKLYDYMRLFAGVKSLIFIFLLLSSIIYISERTLKDVTGNTYHQRIYAFKLPDTSIYKYLGSLDKGMVIELPFQLFPYNTPEESYFYYYNRAIYKFPLINTIVLNNNKYYKDFEYLFNILKRPTKEVVDQLKYLGIKYLVLNKDNKQWNSLINTNGLIMVKRIGNKKLLKIKDSINITAEETLNRLNQISFPYLKRNHKILFNDKMNSDLLIKGFSKIEHWGVWTHSKEAVIKFCTNDQKAKILNLNFNIFTDGRYKQNIEFILNGKVIYQKSLSLINHKVSLHLDGLLKDVNELLIKIPTATSPQELNVSSDRRKLGIGLISLEMK